MFAGTSIQSKVSSLELPLRSDFGGLQQRQLHPRKKFRIVWRAKISKWSLYWKCHSSWQIKIWRSASSELSTFFRLWENIWPNIRMRWKTAGRDRSSFTFLENGTFQSLFLTVRGLSSWSLITVMRRRLCRLKWLCSQRSRHNCIFKRWLWWEKKRE